MVGQLGQSLDGRIATPTGRSHYINGPGALDHLHRLRAAVDAVVVGVNTILRDDPQLTVRRCNGRQPRRVVIDPRGRMPAAARCRNDDSPPPLVIGTRPDGGDDYLALACGAADGLITPETIVTALFKRGYHRLLIEGGATTVSSFVAASALDRLHIMLAPILMGSGTSGLILPPIDGLHEAIRPEVDCVPLGDGDMLFDCGMPSRWAEP